MCSLSFYFFSPFHPFLKMSSYFDLSLPIPSKTQVHLHIYHLSTRSLTFFLRNSHFSLLPPKSLTYLFGADIVVFIRAASPTAAEGRPHNLAFVAALGSIRQMDIWNKTKKRNKQIDQWRQEKERERERNISNFTH